MHSHKAYFKTGMASVTVLTFWVVQRYSFQNCLVSDVSKTLGLHHKTVQHEVEFRSVEGDHR